MGPFQFLNPILFLTLATFFISNVAFSQIQHAQNARHEVEGFYRGSTDHLAVFDGYTDCSFQSFCQILKKNALKQTLYRNSRSEEIWNNSLRRMEKTVNSCLASLATVPVPASPVRESIADQIGRAEKQFLTSVLAHHEGNRWSAIQIQMKTVSPVEDGKLVDEEIVQRYLEKLEESIVSKRRLRHFSAESRALFVYWQSLVRKKSRGVDLPEGQDGVPSLNEDPYANPVMFFKVSAAGTFEKMIANQVRYQQSVERVEALFKDTRARVLRYLEALRSPQNSSELDNMILRVKSVGFKPEVLAERRPYTCMDSPNLFYQLESHSVYVCASVMNYPRESLRVLLAHEITHAIDPCRLSMPLVYSPTSPVAAKTKQELLDEKFSGVYSFSAKTEVDYLSSPWSLDTDHKITSLPVGSVSAVPLRKHPFLNVSSCLASAASIGAVVNSTDFIRESLKNHLQQRSVRSDSDWENKTLTQLSDFMDSYGACEDVKGSKNNVQINESFADWLAGEIEGEVLQNTPEKDQPAIAFESVLYFLAGSCEGVESELMNKVKDHLAQAQCSESGASTEQSYSDMIYSIKNADEPLDSHQNGRRRIERIFFAHPAYRALGCGAPDVTRCQL